MKPYKEIFADKRLFKVHVAEENGYGYLLLKGNNIKDAPLVQWERFFGWDHVIVGYMDHMPTMEEIAIVRDLFFTKHEICIIYVPTSEMYAEERNRIHIWRSQKIKTHVPPKKEEENGL